MPGFPKPNKSAKSDQTVPSTRQTAEWLSVASPENLAPEMLVLHNNIAVLAENVDELKRIVLAVYQTLSEPVEDPEKSSKPKQRIISKVSARTTVTENYLLFEKCYRRYVNGGGKPLTRMTKNTPVESRRFLKTLSLALKEEEIAGKSSNDKQHTFNLDPSTMNQVSIERLYIATCTRFAKAQAKTDLVIEIEDTEIDSEDSENTENDGPCALTSQDENELNDEMEESGEAQNNSQEREKSLEQAENEGENEGESVI